MCFDVDKTLYNEYKIGDTSAVYIYQEVKKVDFQLDENNNISATLYKNLNGNWNNTVNDIFVRFDIDKWKFGANDTYSLKDGTDKYKYVFTSTEPIKYYEGSYIAGNYKIDLMDICLSLNASFNPDCNINLVNSNQLEVTFFDDDGVIDPTYYFINFATSGNYGENVTTEPNNSTHITIDRTGTTDPNMTNLVAYWSFDADSSTTAYDLTGNNNDGTYTNGAYSGTGGYIDDSAQFDGRIS